MQNGRNIVSGSASGGLDTEALLNALADARRLPAVQLETRIDKNQILADGFSALRSILKRFQDASNFLRNPPGVRNADQTFFSTAMPYLAAM
jgi:flagellar capping protein FliD